jgi:hypothetical protein
MEKTKMGAILEGLKKAGEATELPSGITQEQIQQQFNTSTTKYPMANDTPRNRDMEAGVHIAGDFDEDAEEVFIDATLLDQKVRELIIAAGGNYSFKRAVEEGRMIKVDDEFMDAMLRLEAAAPLLQRAVELSMQRSNRMCKIGGSASGSASGSITGVDSTTGTHQTRCDAPGSGTVSAKNRAEDAGQISDVDKVTLARLFVAGNREAGLELLRRGIRRRGTESGSPSGSTSESTSGHVSKAAG